MRRRNVLKSVAFAAAGAGLGATVSAGGQKTVASTAITTRTPFIVTRDGASLFYKDWGKGGLWFSSTVGRSTLTCGNTR
jgi:hypothetical protein